MKLGNLLHMLKMFPTNYNVGVRLSDDECYFGKATVVAPAEHPMTGEGPLIYTKITWMSDHSQDKPLVELDELLKALEPFNTGNPVIFDEAVPEYQDSEEAAGCMDPKRVVAVMEDGDLSPTVWIEVDHVQ